MALLTPRRLRALLAVGAAASLVATSGCLPSLPSTSVSAALKSKGNISIIPRVSAPLAKLNVDLGSRVRAGDTLAELDHADLDRQVQEAQAAQADAEARLAELKAGPKAEVLAQAQANANAAQARVRALEAARGGGDASALQRRVDDARAALAQAEAAARPDPQAVQHA